MDTKSDDTGGVSSGQSLKTRTLNTIRKRIIAYVFLPFSILRTNIINDFATFVGAFFVVVLFVRSNHRDENRDGRHGTPRGIQCERGLFIFGFFIEILYRYEHVISPFS